MHRTSNDDDRNTENKDRTSRRQFKIITSSNEKLDKRNSSKQKRQDLLDGTEETECFVFLKNDELLL